MHKKLQAIIKKTKEDLLKRKKGKPLTVISRSVATKQSTKLRRLPRPFRARNDGGLGIIAEVKLASPTEKKLGDEKDLIKRVKEYEKGGANAISVVTEKHFFKGNPDFVGKIKKAVSLPVLQKDFILDQYQLIEAKNGGADAILLIARIVSKNDLILLVKEAQKIGLEPVVEICSQADLAKALATNTKIIAVNARDLDTFKVDVDKACRLLKKVPDKYIKLGFSGVLSKKEVQKYQVAGVDAILIGTGLMKTNDISGFIKGLRSVGVKICATRSLKAAEAAYKNGAEFLGMVFTPLIKTHTVDMKVAKQIGKSMKGKINLVGVFQSMPLREVQKIIKDCNLDFGQFHGDESSDYLKQIKVKKIKAFRFNGDFSLEKARRQMKKYKVDYYLVDRIKQSEGPMLDLKTVAPLAKEFPLFFAGGLNPDNVAEIVKSVRPLVVDVASGVETNGQQDLNKIKKFIKNAKGVI